MRAIILAAGRGSRMEHLTDERPKCLVNFRGKPLIEWQLEAIRSAGIKEIAIVTGYRNELLASYNLVEFHNLRWYETDMVSSLACAEKWLKAEPCVVSYSDIYYESSAVLSLVNCPVPLAVTYDPEWLKIWKKRFDDPLVDAETFLINSSNEILEIGNKPTRVDEVQGQYMGLLRMTPEGWRQITRILKKTPKNVRDQMHMTGTLQKIIEHAQISVLGVPYVSEWGEFDSRSDLEKFDAKQVLE
jgi:L-glutamine-phosphate cytidylyltransferase